jgi:hypothetical protein
MRPKSQSKRLKGKAVRFDETPEDENSITYQWSNDNSSRTPSDDNNDGDTKSLMTTAPELLVMIVMTEMALVVVLPHLPHKEEVMSDLSLPSRLTNSHNAHRIQTMAPRHRQEFRQVRPMLRLIVLAPLLSGLMMQLSLTHTYHIPDIHSQQPIRWVYECVDPKLYNMCY